MRSGATGASTYATATVNSTRTSNTDPMRARIWIDDPEAPDAVDHVNLSATSAPTASNPYGAFRLDYCGNMEGTPGCAFNGFLEGTAGGVSYFEREQGDGGGGTKALRMTTTSAERQWQPAHGRRQQRRDVLVRVQRGLLPPQR